jgi:hypothetical protein
MTLSGRARNMAAEIKNHDWSDAHTRLDRAGHHHDQDSPSKRQAQLSEDETDRVRMNVVWVTAQVLVFEDPTLKIAEYAEACGVPEDFLRNRDGSISGMLSAGLRGQQTKGGFIPYRPGTNEL